MDSSRSSLLKIVELTSHNYPAFVAHMLRHREENGNDGFYFMPFSRDDIDGPAGVHEDKLQIPLTALGWERGFVAVDAASDNIVGHVSLKGGRLRALLHRCELGLGVEEKYRRQGVGEQLMETGLDFARAQLTLGWMDLSTFGHNLPAQRLYRKLGFQEVGLLRDRIRIGELSIDDLLMTLALR